MGDPTKKSRSVTDVVPSRDDDDDDDDDDEGRKEGNGRNSLIFISIFVVATRGRSKGENTMTIMDHDDHETRATAAQRCFLPVRRSPGQRGEAEMTVDALAATMRRSRERRKCSSGLALTLRAPGAQLVAPEQVVEVLAVSGVQSTKPARTAPAAVLASSAPAQGAVGQAQDDERHDDEVEEDGAARGVLQVQSCT